MKSPALLLLCVLFVSSTFSPVFGQTSKAKAPAAKTEQKETLKNNPFSKVQKELDKIAKVKPTKSSQRRKKRNRIDFLQKRLKSQLEAVLEPLERKQRHLEGRLMIISDKRKRDAIHQQIAQVKKQMTLYKNTADLEKYSKIKAEDKSTENERKKKGKKSKRSKKSKK